MAVATLINRTPMTLEQFESLPEGPPFYDYVNGEAIEVNRPTGRHMEIEHVLYAAIRTHVRASGLGIAYPEIDVKLPTGNWVGPDILFLSYEHENLYDAEKGDVYGTPDLIVEVSSPKTRAYDRVEKRAMYREAGVPWLWYVDQDTLLIEECRLGPNAYELIDAAAADQPFRPKVFPGLEIVLGDLMGQAEDSSQR